MNPIKWKNKTKQNWDKLVSQTVKMQSIHSYCVPTNVQDSNTVTTLLFSRYLIGVWCTQKKNGGVQTKRDQLSARHNASERTLAAVRREIVHVMASSQVKLTPLSVRCSMLCALCSVLQCVHTDVKRVASSAKSVHKHRVQHHRKSALQPWWWLLCKLTCFRDLTSKLATEKWGQMTCPCPWNRYCVETGLKDLSKSDLFTLYKSS